MRALADLILIAHGAVVLFIVAGLPAIWIGASCGWRWVRNFWFRVAHLAAIVFVAAEALLGIACPLTVWEAASAHESLVVIFIGVAITLPAIIVYTVYMYRVFWGKARELTYY